jgi:hypothetical protein
MGFSTGTREEIRGKVESQQFSEFEKRELATKLERAAKEKAREEHKATQRQHRSTSRDVDGSGLRTPISCKKERIFVYH